MWITLLGGSATTKRTIRTRLMASSRAFLSSVTLALLTLTTSRLWRGVGGMGNTERGGGVAVESEEGSAAGAGLGPLIGFLPRAMFDMSVIRRRERRIIREGKERKGERVTWHNSAIKSGKSVPFPSSNQFAPVGPSPVPTQLVPSPELSHIKVLFTVYCLHWFSKSS